MIFVDSRIPLYLVGAAHPHKADAQRLLEKLISDRQRLVTDAEVLQEILHHYVAIDRREAIQPELSAILVPARWPKELGHKIEVVESRRFEESRPRLCRTAYPPD